MFEVAYETTFCATHVLHRDGQPIEPQHGHDWRVEVVAAGATLDTLGVVVDFEHLKQAVAAICARFHYGDITTHPDFAGQSPSAEAVARYSGLGERLTHFGYSFRSAGENVAWNYAGAKEVVAAWMNSPG